MILYKLTDMNGYTRHGHSNQLLWREGTIHTATKSGIELCSGSVIHAYYDPLLAVLLDPIHGDYGVSARLFECSGEVVAKDHQLKCGVKTLHCIREMSKPGVITEQRVKFAILCTKLVYKDNLKWNK